MFAEKPVCSAICANSLVKSAGTKALKFCLAWDMPKIHFYYKQQDYYRYESDIHIGIDFLRKNKNENLYNNCAYVRKFIIQNK